MNVRRRGGRRIKRERKKMKKGDLKRTELDEGGGQMYYSGCLVSTSRQMHQPAT